MQNLFDLGGLGLMGNRMGGGDPNVDKKLNDTSEQIYISGITSLIYIKAYTDCKYIIKHINAYITLSIITFISVFQVITELTKIHIIDRIFYSLFLTD